MAACDTGVLALLDRLCILESWGGTGVLDGAFNDNGPAPWRPGRGLEAWMVMPTMMRLRMMMLMNDDEDEAWKDFSHAKACRAHRISHVGILL